MAILTLGYTGTALAEVTGAADNLRTGWYPDEPSLTHALLSGGGFQQVFKDPLQGQIYAQPLTANGMLLVVTEDNRAYGLNPRSGAVRWAKQFGAPVDAGEEGKDPIKCTDLAPHVGITGTPVIDTEHNIAYFVSNRYISESSGPIGWYMHAIKLDSGEEVAHFPVKIDGEAQNLPGVEFKAPQELQRPALLLMNGVVYAGFGSHCDNYPYQGWVMGVSTLGEITTKWATSSHGGSIWQSGGGLISDGTGQILFSTGNDEGTPGEWDPPVGPGNKPPEGRLGESVVRAEVQAKGALAAKDFFSPFNNKTLDEGDVDLGSSAPIALPSQYFGTPSVPNLLVQDGKAGNVYLLNRDNLGGMGQGAGVTDGVLQKYEHHGGVWDGAAVWPGEGGYVYIPTVSPPDSSGQSVGSLLFFKYDLDNTGAPALSVAAESPEEFQFGSGSPIVTSAGTTGSSGILWITRCKVFGCGSAELVAYNPVPVANKPQELWKAPIGTANKFSRPDASIGHLYVGNGKGEVFGFGRPESKTEQEANERTEREANERPEREAKEKAEREAKEKIEREAKEKAESTRTGGIVNIANLVAAPTGPTVASEPPLILTELKLRASASRLSAHRRKLVITYTLSAAGTLDVVIYRRVNSHRCRRGIRTCVRYLPTTIKRRFTGPGASNVLTINLGRLSPGSYRLAATPIARSGAPGTTRYLYFKAVR